MTRPILSTEASTHAVGVDLIELDRIAHVLARHPLRFLSRIYTPLEVAFCRGRVPELAARFAAKEAVMKALGTGVRSVGWRDIEVLPDRRGKPLVYLHGRAVKRAAHIGLEAIDISLTHLRDQAMAVVVCRQLHQEQNHEAARAHLILRLRERGLIDESIT